MPSLQHAQQVPYSPKQMFDLVNDVKAYPEFLPWCERSEILSANEDAMSASLHVAWGGLTQTLTTKNTWQCHVSIDMQMLDGPFESFHGHWTFEALPSGGTLVGLDMKFQWKNRLWAMMLDKVFQQVLGTFVQAFALRAKEKYGP